MTCCSHGLWLAAVTASPRPPTRSLSLARSAGVWTQARRPGVSHDSRVTSLGYDLSHRRRGSVSFPAAEAGSGSWERDSERRPGSRPGQLSLSSSSQLDIQVATWPGQAATGLRAGTQWKFKSSARPKGNDENLRIAILVSKALGLDINFSSHNSHSQSLSWIFLMIRTTISTLIWYYLCRNVNLAWIFLLNKSVVS